MQIGKGEQPVWAGTANGANKKLVLHVQLRCGSLSITIPMSHLANEFDVRSELHGQVSLAVVNQIMCRSWGYERVQTSKDLLKAQWDNSFEQTKHMWKLIGKKIFSFTLNNLVYLNLCIIKSLHCSGKLGLFLTWPLFLINIIDMFFRSTCLAVHWIFVGVWITDCSILDIVWCICCSRLVLLITDFLSPHL